MPKSNSEETKILTDIFRHDRAKSILTKGSIIPPDRPPLDDLHQAAKAIRKPLFPEGSPLEVITPLDRFAFTRLGYPVASFGSAWRAVAVAGQGGTQLGWGAPPPVG